MNKIQSKLLIIVFAIFAFAQVAPAQTTAFSYQGRLTDSSMQANGTYDLGFALFDAATGGAQIGAAQTRAAVTVSNGIFTVQLDFGAAAFPGANRFLEIAVKRPADSTFTTLAPRQQVTSTPYAIRAVSAQAADTATNSTQLGGAAANQFVQTADSRLSDSRDPRAGSGNYVQNQNSAVQTSTNFRIEGSGEANIFNARTQYNIGGDRALFTENGSSNTFVGLRSGKLNNGGSLNVFVGDTAGTVNTNGGSNSFVGAQSGQANQSGNFNSFFGRFSGNRNTTGELNSFLGAESGTGNTTGNLNSFFGESSGNSNVTGSQNLALGAFSNFGANNLSYATAIGSFSRVAASDTIVIGKTAGTYFSTARPADAVQIPGTLTVTGAISGTVSNATNAINATQLGGVAASNFVQTDSTAFIRNQTTQQTGDFNVSGAGTANIFNATQQYNFGGSRVLGVPNSTSVTLGLNAGNGLAAGNTNNTFVGSSAGVKCRTLVNLGDCLSNTFFGANSGAEFLVGSNNTYIGLNAGSSDSSGTASATRGTNVTALGANAAAIANDLNYATAIGAGATVGDSNTIALGRNNGADKVLIPGAIDAQNSLAVRYSISAGGGISLNDTTLRLRNSSDNSHSIRYNSAINGMQFTAFDGYQWVNVRNNRINMQLDTNGTLSIRGSYDQISDARYKTNVQTFAGALDAVKRLRGVTFNWKPEASQNPNLQIGFIAQEVEAVLPELVHTDDKGYKTVAYSNAVPVLVEAVKEQQTQIEAKQQQLDVLREQIKQQQATIDALKKLVCAGNPQAEICLENKQENK